MKSKTVLEGVADKMKRDRIIFRLDDICDTMNMDHFFRMKELLDKYDIKPLLGVVPLNADSKLVVNKPYHGFLELMHSCRNSGWSIAMHGTHHLYDSSAKGIVTKRPKSEFAGKSVEDQICLLKKGREKMMADGLDTDIFFAPGHSYDENTILALKTLGFHVISDGRSHGNYQWRDMDFVPVRYYRFETEPAGVTTLCFHLNNMDEEMFGRTENYIRRYIDNVISFEEAVRLSKWNTVAALIDERMFVFYEYRIHPLLSAVKREILKKE